MDGRSLFPAIVEGESVRESIYIETYMPAHDAFAELLDNGHGKKVKVGARRYGILAPPWKYIVTEPFPLLSAKQPELEVNLTGKVSKKELYNIGNDPLELVSLIDTEDGSIIANELAGALQAYLESEPSTRNGSSFLPDSEHIDKLRSLGYID